MRVVVALAAALFAVGCASNATPRTTTERTVRASLLTHCGIDELRVGRTYYEADRPLDDGSGNPPQGWPNPLDNGLAHVRTDGKVVFTDSRGHTVTFHVRNGATSYKMICS